MYTFTKGRLALIIMSAMLLGGVFVHVIDTVAVKPVLKQSYNMGYNNGYYAVSGEAMFRSVGDLCVVAQKEAKAAVKSKNAARAQQAKDWLKEDCSEAYAKADALVPSIDKNGHYQIGR